MNSLYALTSDLPSSIIRKILYYTGIGTNTSILIKRKIKYQSRIYENPNWMDQYTFWSVYRKDMPRMLLFHNPLNMPELLWFEIRIMMMKVINKNQNMAWFFIDNWYNAHQALLRKTLKTIVDSEITVKK